MTGIEMAPQASARGVLARINPVAKLAASALIALPLVFTLDWLSAATAVVLELALLPLAGWSARTFWRRTWPVWLAAPLTAVTIALYGQSSGTVYAQWWMVHISAGSLELAFATAVRVVAIALPSVVLFADVDPTDLADGLGQVWHLPARFVLSALAGIRLAVLFIDDWRTLEHARRARGVADWGRMRRLAGMAFALLVLSVRRGSQLATAMETRGFGAPVPRTWARESRFAGPEWATLAVGAVISATAVTVALAVGTWNYIIGPN